MMMILVVMRFLNRLSDEHGREVCEDEGLDRRHQQLQEEHEDGEGNRDEGESDTDTGADVSEDEDHEHHAQDHDVTCEDVREKTYREGNRLDEQ